MIKYISYICLLLLTTLVASAQDHYFKQINVDAGLSHNLVFCTTQDDYGFMWFGTKDGLNRYDGYKIKIFRNIPDNPYSIGSNDIRALLSKSKNELWVATSKGLFVLDVVNEKFHELLPFNNTFVSGLLKDGTDVWVIANHALYKIGLRDTIKMDLPAGITSAVCKLTTGRIWVGTTNGKIGSYNTNSKSFELTDIFDKQYGDTRWIEKLTEGYNNQLLIGTASAGLKSYNLTSKYINNILLYDNYAKPVYVRDILRKTSVNEIWVATESGIYVFSSDNQLKQHIIKDLKNAGGLPDNAIYSLTIDWYENIWAGTYFKGAGMYPNQNMTFNTTFNNLHFENANDELLFKNSIIREICSDQNGDLWMGTEDNGIYKLEKDRKRIRHFTSSALPGALSYHNIHGMLCSGDTLWVGTFEKGLDLVDIRTGLVIRHFDKKNNKDLASNFVITFCKTKTNRIYIGTGWGLQVYNPQSQSFDNVPGIPNDFIYALLESPDGRLYIGTENNGLLIYNPLSNKTTSLNDTLKSSIRFPNFKINCLFADARDNVFIGTDGSGLFIYSQRTGQLTNYTTANGYPSNFIYKIVQDPYNNTWCTTARGLVLLQNNQITAVYTRENGLPSNQFSYNSGFTDTGGDIFLGSSNGLVYFSPPSRITALQPQDIPLYFTGLRISGQEVTTSDVSSPLKKSLLNSDSLTLAYNQSTFSIDFSALVYTYPNNIVYSYRIAGADDKWTPLKEGRTIYFTQLPQGDYQLQITTINQYDKNYTGPVKTLHLIVLPPFWKSRWAYISYILLLAGGTYLFIRYYYRQQKKLNERKMKELEHKREADINQTKIDFFTNIAHEIKTPLTLIQGPVEDLLEKATREHDNEYELKLIEKNTNHLLELTNQLLDFRKIESATIQTHPSYINVTDLVDEVFDTFKIAAKGRNLDYRLILKTEKNTLTIYSDKDLFSKILYNLFSNGIKYSETYFEVVLYKQHTSDAITLEFINDGEIIPEDSFSKIFQPFYRFSNRVSREGTGIGLSFAHSLTQTLGGSLTVHVIQAKNIFTLTIPQKI